MSFKVNVLLISIFLFSANGFAKKIPVNSKGETKTLVKQAESSPELRQKRRVGLGALAAGALGLGGTQLELNLSRTWGLIMGYGGGGGFQAIQVQGKYALSGDWLIPYLITGYTRWQSNQNEGPISDTKPPVLGERLLTDNEKRRGQFSKNIVYPGFGVQFLQLKGDWAGASFFGEFLFLLDVETLSAGPTGGVGMMYYF